MSRRTRGPGAHHDQRRDQIADAVLAIVAEQGLPAVSLSTVAARADVSSGRVQHYFPAKKQLIEAAFDRANALSSARIAEKVGAELTAAPPRDVLTVVLTELIPYDAATRTHMRVRQSFTALALSDEVVAARIRTEYDRLHRTLAALVRRDQEAGQVSGAVYADAAAVRLVALAEGLAYYVLVGIVSAESARGLVVAAVDDVYSTGRGRSGPHAAK